MKPRVCILRTDGTNCDRETLHAFAKAGGNCNLVHVNQLRNGGEKLADYQIMAIPGGFSYGDDIHSGKVLSVELASFLQDQLRQFIEDGKLIIGICNGFQVLVRTGLLPRGELGNIRATLMQNDSGKFECRWVNLRVENSNCVFTRGLEGTILQYQVAHGEGKFYTNEQTLQEIEGAGQVVFRYADARGNPTQDYPANPNGSLHAIAGICDQTGRVLGLMPHPERFVETHHHPNWRRIVFSEPHGMALFRNAVDYALNK
ncbi:phosphoribosylformylglycinamidine synthase I [Desulfoscipio geothermicus]|uniref:Phosphoribosylformylglycinamidine synthase subunit PurQ n=1 Tax=Desulfoscipio geothermicus DSM 3669 TaxID=1121426 RepID=A0A1I6DXS8_9FIRM|nr:phosphoribosylformylglycinamidine synthase I [Desulfoscipio geothermicus]SFR10132.1 phosphoribosylformylglycinamidine synthase subunit I [Desulfoscipio geothermicus DSM 3669]